ncbi:MAG TPA: 3-hydroxyacyl-CoA dehydrogenase family protein, partial [Candidatus Poseidoniales archaeon]|nr:3-hydroxyacyl-CoA dehydrogenase family protein [Candidatus Poseidoniales archaeon]
MGAGIAAHCANAGCKVLLLDIAKEGDDRSAIARTAVEQMAKSNPEMLMHKRNAKLISSGNIEDDLDKLSEADWVIEVIIENLDIKQKLYASMSEHLGPRTIVSSNTSTLPRSELVEGMSSEMASRFLITHFFNPPRYLPLLEVVTSSEVNDSVTDRLCAFADERLGKRVIMCNDTPGFVGNRLGVYFIQRAFKATIDHGFTVEQADAMLGRPVGIPKTGVFGLMDLVGIDLSVHVIESLFSHLPDDDPFRDIVGTGEDIIQTMIADGYTGRKGKGGFYRLNKEDGKRVKEARNLTTGEYAPADRKAAFPSARMGKQGLGPLMDYPDEGAAFISDILLDTLSYAAHLVPDVTDDIYSIDTAMKAGYSWKSGPFQMMDSIGSASMVERL